MSKCNVCKRKITLAQQEISKCKCEKLHCLTHRYPETHSCEKFNEIKQDEKFILTTSLVKITGNKNLIKI